MNTAKSSHYLLVLRTANTAEDISPDEMQQSLERGLAWIKKMKDAGHYLGGDPLGDRGKVLRGLHGRQMSDGPFVEGKEIVAGYVLISAKTFAEALEVARGCPGLARGASVEVRPVEEFSNHG